MKGGDIALFFVLMFILVRKNFSEPRYWSLGHKCSRNVLFHESPVGDLEDQELQGALFAGVHKDGQVRLS